MKIKIKRVKAGKTVSDRMAGIAEYRVTGPNHKGERVTKIIYGTRDQVQRLFEEQVK